MAGNWLIRLKAFLFIVLCLQCALRANAASLNDESAREDKTTGGRIERTVLQPGNGDIRITVDVPAFLLTLWQGNKEVAVYHVGVGLKDFPISIGERTTNQIILNPDWIPPDSVWVRGSKTVKPGERITARDPRNPLGKIKIPLGNGYLLHEAKGIGDLGNLVSHGCVRVLRRDLVDLSKKIARAQELNVTTKEFDQALLTKKQKVIELIEPLMVDINYDTVVVENGKLHVYPDIYDFGVNTVEILRDELESNGVDTSELTEATLKKILARAVGKNQFVVALNDVKSNLALTRGRVLPVVGRANVRK